jgi:hypothetical protein
MLFSIFSDEFPEDITSALDSISAQLDTMNLEESIHSIDPNGDVNSLRHDLHNWIQRIHSQVSNTLENPDEFNYSVVSTSSKSRQK